jgi:CheY-specific phosphatase CheX
MNRTEIDKQLAAVAEDTFASMAFIFPGEGQEAAGGDLSQSVTSRVTFDGPFEGELVLTVSREMLGVLACNLLGMETLEEVPADRQLDALKELLNVICGNLLPRIGTLEAVFNVSAPVIQGEQDASGNARELAGQTDLLLECGRARLTLLLPDSAATAVADIRA